MSLKELVHFIYQIGWHRLFIKFLSNLLMSVESVVMPFPCLSFLLVICIFHLFSLLSLARDLPVVLMLFKEQAFGFFDFFFDFLIPIFIEFCFKIYFFFLLVLGLYFSSFQRWKFNFRSFIFYNKSIQCYTISFKYCFCCIPRILISCIFILNYLKLLEYFFFDLSAIQKHVFNFLI